MMVVIRVSFQTRLGRIGSALFRESASAVLSGERRATADISYVIVNDEIIHRLNSTYLRHDRPTDIITFPLSEGTNMEGEIYISADSARRNATEYGVGFQDELARLAIHGVLHLCGYDDGTDDEKTRMRMLEDRYLGRLARFSGRNT